jgi:hypothetical protein
MRFRNYILQVFLHKRQRKEGKAKETTKAKPTKDIKNQAKMKEAEGSCVLRSQ